MLQFLEKIKAEHSDDESLIAISEIENELTEKKYGLVWEQHEEAVDVQMRDNVPVFTEVKEREIKGNPDSEDYNFLLEGDNLHSLKLLEKTHKGKIDVIYIDPPYNTVNKDFIYNDSRIGYDDGYRHSKWLSFMNERLLIARKLLSRSGVLIISIGYQEVHDLMLLCEELFDNKQVVCVTVQTSGGKPNGGFNISQEYVIFITPNDFLPNASEDLQNKYSSPYHGMNLATFNQEQRPNQAYPIFIDSEGLIKGYGKSLQDKVNDGTYGGKLSDYKYDYSEAPEGTVAVFPVTQKGDPCVWRLIGSRMMSDWEKGYIKVVPIESKKTANKFTVQYLSAGVISKIESGELKTHRINDKCPTLEVEEYKTAGVTIPTIWTDKKYHTTNGSNEIKKIFGEKVFSYPKPLVLIKDILNRVTDTDSLVVDFFAGSGTTAHAVLELNNYDNGTRKYILCTNNENNICESVTYKRIKKVIEGYSDCEPISSNLKYYKTDFIQKTSDDEEYSVEEKLTEHIKEMIQLEWGTSLDDDKYVLLFTDEEADTLEADKERLEKCKGIYISSSVLLTSKQENAFSNIPVHIIPDYYFESELREVGEL